MASQRSAAPPHPHVTVDDVWRGALPQQTELVAGAAGSRREVVWCTALRARPPAFTPLRGGGMPPINPPGLTAGGAPPTPARPGGSLARQAVGGGARLRSGDVWRGALPQQTELVAGAAGSRREVVWCTALRARPPAFTPLRGGELLLINPQVLTAVDARLTLARLVESLAGQAVAGAAVLGRVSPEARRVADAHGLPLFSLPATTPLDQVEQQVLRYVVDRRAELHERAQDLHRQLSELALAGRGLPALLARLQELTGVPVVLERGSGMEYVGARRRPFDRTAAASGP